MISNFDMLTVWTSVDSRNYRFLIDEYQYDVTIRNNREMDLTSSANGINELSSKREEELILHAALLDKLYQDDEILPDQMI